MRLRLRRQPAGSPRQPRGALVVLGGSRRFAEHEQEDAEVRAPSSPCCRCRRGAVRSRGTARTSRAHRAGRRCGTDRSPGWPARSTPRAATRPCARAPPPAPDSRALLRVGRGSSRPCRARTATRNAPRRLPRTRGPLPLRSAERRSRRAAGALSPARAAHVRALPARHRSAPATTWRLLRRNARGRSMLAPIRSPHPHAARSRHRHARAHAAPAAPRAPAHPTPGGSARARARPAAGTRSLHTPAALHTARRLRRARPSR